METLKIQYTSRKSMKLGEDYETTEIGAEWEFPVPDGADVDQEFGKGFIVLRSAVDRHFIANLGEKDVQASPQRENLKERSERQSRELQERVFTKKEDADAPPAISGSSEYRVFEAGSTKSDIVENQAVLLENVRVWEVKEDKTRNNKRYGYVRVGSKESVPGNYATIKSYEPPLINKLVALSEGDHINVFGHYESWMGRESVQDEPETYMWDFVPERIEKA